MDKVILRQTVAQLFTRALIQMFPKVVVSRAHADEIGFSFEFILDAALDETQLKILTESVHRSIREGVSPKVDEMMRKNAIDMFHHIRQPLLAEDLIEHEASMADVVFIDEYRGLGVNNVMKPEPMWAFSIEVKPVAKRDFRGAQRDVFRLEGFAEEDRKALKAHKKKIKEAKLRDHLVLGPKQKLFTIETEGYCFLEKGIWAKEALISWWRKNTKFEEVISPLGLDIFTMHQRIFERRKGEILLPFGIKEWDRYDRDWMHCFVSGKQIEEACISSLQLVEKFSKIAGLEGTIRVVSPREVKGDGFKSEFVAEDVYGREHVVSSVRVEAYGDIFVVKSSLFCSLACCVALLIEQHGRLGGEVSKIFEGCEWTENQSRHSSSQSESN